MNAKVLLYGDRVTESMQRDRRNRTPPRIARRIQPRHGITPETIVKSIRAGIEAEATAHAQANAAVGRSTKPNTSPRSIWRSWKPK